MGGGGGGGWGEAGLTRVWWSTAFFAVACRKLSGLICYFLGFCLFFCYWRI